MDRQAGRNCGSVSLQCAQLNYFTFWQISYRMTWDLDVNDGYNYVLVSEWSWCKGTTIPREQSRVSLVQSRFICDVRETLCPRATSPVVSAAGVPTQMFIFKWQEPSPDVVSLIGAKGWSQLMLQSPQREELTVDGWDSRTSDVNRTFPVYNRSQRCLFKHEHDRSLT